jgi:hypothetical protein
VFGRNSQWTWSASHHLGLAHSVRRHSATEALRIGAASCQHSRPNGDEGGVQSARQRGHTPSVDGAIMNQICETDAENAPAAFAAKGLRDRASLSFLASSTRRLRRRR